MSDIGIHWLGVTALVVALVVPPETMAYEHAFSKTPVGEIEIRTLPEARLLATGTSGAYFDHSGTLFKRLFDYINANSISMTVPVEGNLDQAEMRFYVGRDVPPELDATDDVRVVNVPRRRVASLGAKGAYSETNVNRARERLESWVETQSEWSPDGAPHAVFWNGPFTPWFMKRFEVHLPVKPTGDG